MAAWIRPQHLLYPELFGAPRRQRPCAVVNGYRCFNHEISKALQLTNLEKLGLPYPKAHVINHPSQALAAAAAIGYPVVIKPNIGGSGRRN